MANPEHLEILKQGPKLWKKWREEHPEVRPDLREANLRGARLSHAHLSNADLRKADLREANLNGARLSGADLGEANLSGARLGAARLRIANLNAANLRGATLNGCDLRGADLGAANLSGADFSGARLRSASLTRANLSGSILHWVNLRGAELTGARARGTKFAALDLSETKGLEALEHGGPSTIGIDTIYRSRGKIPEVFLRGCGVPDNFIAYMHSLAGQAFEFYSCFISYSTKDQEFAERLHADLQAKGVRCWFAPEEMKAGRKVHEQIDEAIRLHDKLLLILSEHSMSSEWVKTELAKARKREVKDDKRVLFPVRLVGFEALRDWECFDADTGKDSAREIREYFIPDFSNWKEHDSYRVAFDRLVKDLKQSA